MQRPADIEGEEVGDVDQRIDWPQPDRRQPPLQPGRARPVAHGHGSSAQHPGTGRRRNRPTHRAVKQPLDRRRRPRLQRPNPRRRQIRAHPTHTQRIAAVRRDRDIDHRVIEPGVDRVGGPDRRILRQVDDAGMVLAQPHLAEAEQHARGLHAADLAHLQHRIQPRNMAARRREHRLHPGPRIRRAADHGDRRAIAHIHRADAQPVRIRVLHRRRHLGDAERRQRGRPDPPPPPAPAHCGSASR